MPTKTLPAKQPTYTARKSTYERSERSSKNDYQDKLETIRRKEVRKHKRGTIR